jgi:hypothetical protein
MHVARSFLSMLSERNDPTCVMLGCASHGPRMGLFRFISMPLLTDRSDRTETLELSFLKVGFDDS